MSEKNEVLTQKAPPLTQTVVTDENGALNVLVNYLGVAQRRGAFSLDEAAKIYECIKMFQKNVTS